LKRGLLVLLGALLGLALAEGALRAWLAAKGAPHRARDAEAAAALLIAPMLSPIPKPRSPLEDERPWSGHVLHPYYGFEEAASTLGQVVIEARAQAEAEPAEYRVLVLGGSVAGMFASSAGDHLAALLERDPRFAGRRVVCFNHGRGSFKQPQMLMLFGWLLQLGYRPHAVIEIDGFNEAAIGSSNREQGLHPLFPAFAPWAMLGNPGISEGDALDGLLEIHAERRRAEAIARTAVLRGHHHSALLSRWTLRRLARCRQRWFAATERCSEALAREQDLGTWRGPPFNPEPIACRIQVTRAWLESSRSMQALCRPRDIHYLHVLQPTQHDPGSKPLAPAEIASGKLSATWEEGIRLGYPMLRVAGAHLRGFGVNFLDASRVFERVSEPVYVDGCHFDRHGSRILAERIAEVFLASLPEAGSTR
jgi:hypothetical protein